MGGNSSSEGGTRPQFVHIPKNAGTSIEEYASKHGFEWGSRRHNWPSPTPLCIYDFTLNSGQLAGNSYPGSAWHVPPRIWIREGSNPYAEGSFCVVRNPYSRTVSNFLWEEKLGRLGSGPLCDVGKLNDYVHTVLSDPALASIPNVPSDVPASGGKWDCHLLPAWVYTGNSCGIVLRFENLQEQFTALMTSKFGIAAADAELPNQNSASCELAVNALDDRSRELVQHVYAEDFIRFGYPTSVAELTGRDAVGFLDVAEAAVIERMLKVTADEEIAVRPATKVPQNVRRPLGASSSQNASK